MSKLSDVLPTFVDDSVEEWKEHPRYQGLWVSNQGKFRRGDTFEDSKPLKVYKSVSYDNITYSIYIKTTPEKGCTYVGASSLVAELFLPNPLGYSYKRVSIRDPEAVPPYRASNLYLGRNEKARQKARQKQTDKPYSPYTYSAIINSSYKTIAANKIQKGEIKPEEVLTYIRRRMYEDNVKMYEDPAASLEAGRRHKAKRRGEEKA